jgi:hypothetical protein
VNDSAKKATREDNDDQKGNKKLRKINEERTRNQRQKKIK